MKFWNQAMCLQGKTGQDLAKWNAGPISGSQMFVNGKQIQGNLQINNEISNVKLEVLRHDGDR